MVWSVVYSICYSFGILGFLSEGPTLKHWISAIGNGEIASTTILSVGISLQVTLVSTAAAIGLVLLAPRGIESRTMMTMVSVLLGMPVAIHAFVVYQIFSGGGLVSRALHSVGLVGSPDEMPAMVNDGWSIGICIALTASSFPIVYLYFSQLWATLRLDKHCRLAECIGATRWQGKLRVALPMLLRKGRPMIAMSFLSNLGSFEIPLLLGRQSPQMFSVLTYRRSGLYDLARRPEAFAIATVYFGMCLIVLIVYLRWREHDE